MAEPKKITAADLEKMSMKILAREPTLPVNKMELLEKAHKEYEAAGGRMSFIAWYCTLPDWRKKKITWVKK